MLIFAIMPETISQVFINRDMPITSSEVFGIRKELNPLFGNQFGGIYTETVNSPSGRPFYGYAMDGSVKAYHYFNGQDQGWHLYAGANIFSAWKDSIKIELTNGNPLNFYGHRLAFGENGNTILGYEAAKPFSSSNIGNTVMGWNAARDMNGGVSNTILGFFAGESMSTGDFNTFMGTDAGRDVTGGSRNTYLGYWAGRNAGTNASGNLFLGYRAGQNESGSNKLYISNSETANPLIYGDFLLGDIKFNADAEFTGNSTFFGSLQVNGITTLNNQLNTEDISINDNSPFLEFRQLGSSKYYFQYLNNTDEFVLHETGLGQVLKVKDGEVFFPQLAGSTGKQVEIDPATGKLSVVDAPTSWSYQRWDFSDGPYGNGYLAVNDLRNGVTLSQMLVTVVEYPEYPYNGFNDTYVLNRIHKTTGVEEQIFVISFNEDNVGSTPITYLDNVPESPGVNVIDNDTYYYYVWASGEEHILTLKLTE